MKPFNLEAAKAGEPVMMVDKRPVRLICFDRMIEDGKLAVVVGLVRNEYGNDEMNQWLVSGETYAAPDALVMATVERTRTVWINVYHDTVVPYASKVQADNRATFARIACVEAVLKWEE